MIASHAAGHVLARGGCVFRDDVAVAAEVKPAAHPVALSHTESAERRAVVSRDIRRTATLSRDVSNRANRGRIGGADANYAE
jgi:hypothetical protein